MLHLLFEGFHTTAHLFIFLEKLLHHIVHPCNHGIVISNSLVHIAEEESELLAGISASSIIFQNERL